MEKFTKDSTETARTSGDGMEQDAISKTELKKEPTCTEQKQCKRLISDQLKVNPENSTNIVQNKPFFGSNCPPSISEKIAKGKLHYLIPKLIPAQKCSQSKNERKPRFIPFEPYKCAVKPIIPWKKSNKLRRNKNNLDINILVSQMSDMKRSELNSITNQESKQELELKTECDKEKEILLQQIDELKKEREYAQSQLKFQIQVNSELKNLLVAAVGEDMQTKVNVLTEDKLQLARALLDTVNNLSTHTEQIEFLAGQCEVWRSKFLASSVMVEELARWKADLTSKNALLSNSSKRMLQLTAQIREMQIDILKNLKFLSKLKQLNLPSNDLISLTSECLNISQQMVLHCGIGMPENLILQNLRTLTQAEQDSIEALESISQPLMSTDEAFKAIVGQAFSPKPKGFTLQTEDEISLEVTKS